MLAVYEAINITLNPPHTLIKNLLGHDFGALKATKCPHNKPHITHKAGRKDGIVIIFMVFIEHGIKNTLDIFFLLPSYHQH